MLLLKVLAKLWPLSHKAASVCLFLALPSIKVPKADWGSF